MEFDGGERDVERFRERLMQRFLTQSTGASREDIDYLRDKVDRPFGADSIRTVRGAGYRFVPRGGGDE